MAPPKKIELEDVEAPKVVADPAPPADDINAQIAAEVAKRIKSRAFASSATVGKAGLFDVAKHANGIDYTVGGLLELRWCNDEPVNVANKRMKGYMFPEEAHPHLKNIRQNNLVLMVRTKEAADSHREEIRKLSANLDGQAFETSSVVEQANKLRPNAGKVFRDFEKIQAG